MLATGELIRSMNYVDDITATLRRICISIPPMTTDERKRLAESLRTVNTAINAAITDLEKAGQ
jgi:ribosome recycling factor